MEHAETAQTPARARELAEGRRLRSGVSDVNLEAEESGLDFLRACAKIAL